MLPMVDLGWTLFGDAAILPLVCAAWLKRWSVITVVVFCCVLCRLCHVIFCPTILTKLCCTYCVVNDGVVNSIPTSIHGRPLSGGLRANLATSGLRAPRPLVPSVPIGRDGFVDQLSVPPVVAQTVAHKTHQQRPTQLPCQH